MAIDQWPPVNGSGIYQNLDGGFPLVIFNEAMDTAVVLSPATIIHVRCTEQLQESRDW